MTEPQDDLFTAVQRDLAGVYSLDREVGRGGMAVVYLASEVELNRSVALKVLPRERAKLPGVRERFLREARIAAGLSHPNIIPIYRVGEIGETVFFAMMYVDGGTLGDRLRQRGPLTPAAAARMLREVGQALAYAHGRGIVHRDIKPDNILLDNESGRAIVSDFGIAAASESASEEIAGTPFFMSPEQSTGEPIDARSDLFSLGVLGYLSVSGKLPSGAEVIDAAIADRTAALTKAAPATPRALVAAIEKCLERDPQERFENAELFVMALERKSSGQPDMPHALREWAEKRDPWFTGYLLWIGITTFVIIMNRYALGGPTRLLFTAGLAVNLLVLVSAPLLPALIFQLRSALPLLKSGYRVDDLIAALREEQTQREARYGESDYQSRWFHLPAQGVAWFMTAWLGVSLTTGTNSPALPDRVGDLLGGGWIGTFVQYAVPGLLSFFALPLLTAFGIPLIPGIKNTKQRVRSFFWNSPLGSLAARILSRGKKQSEMSARTFRPTESVLAIAISDLFASLPSAYRNNLSELPAVADRLENHASNAREILAHCEGPQTVDDDVQRISQRAKRELAESVGALESIRLELLRLLGGDADLRPATTALFAAKRVNDELDRLRDAQREVDLLINPLGLDLRPNSPA